MQAVQKLISKSKHVNIISEYFKQCAACFLNETHNQARKKIEVLNNLPVELAYCDQIFHSFEALFDVLRQFSIITSTLKGMN